MTSITSTDLGFTLIFSGLIITNLLGNGVVCLVVLRYRGMRAPINYLLVNLAVADMMVALGVGLQYVIIWAFHHPSGTAGDLLCKFVTGGNVIWIGGVASAFFLVAIAVERYLAVVRPLGDRPQLTSRRLVAVITAGWIFALVYNLPLFFVVRLNDGVNHCTERWPNKTMGKAFTVACLFVYGAIPIGSMVFLYSRVLYNLWKDGICATQLSEQARIRSKLKVTKMVAVVSILYAVCWLPNLVIYMLSHFKAELFGHGSYFFVPAFVVSVVLVGLNSAMNPFIYALHSTNFRQHIKGALCCKTYRSGDFLNSYGVNLGSSSASGSMQWKGKQLVNTSQSTL